MSPAAMNALADPGAFRLCSPPGRKAISCLTCEHTICKRTWNNRTIPQPSNTRLHGFQIVHNKLRAGEAGSIWRTEKIDSFQILAAKAGLEENEEYKRLITLIVAETTSLEQLWQAQKVCALSLLCFLLRTPVSSSHTAPHVYKYISQIC